MKHKLVVDQQKKILNILEQINNQYGFTGKRKVKTSESDSEHSVHDHLSQDEDSDGDLVDPNL